MKKSLAGLGLASLALAIVAPAHAGTSADFAGCDGLKKPKRSDDGMRGEASISSWRFGNMSNPQKTIDSCNRALESGKLRPEQTLRRAHVMRARGAAKLELGDSEGALADFLAAEKAGAEYAGDFFYQRSMGVSLDLLKAIVLNDTGRREEALVLADKALATRPYALAVQRVATMLRAGNDETPADSEIWLKLGQIDPATRGLAGNLAQNAEDLASLATSAGEPSVTMPTAPSMQSIMQNGGNVTALIGEYSAPVAMAMKTAYALAANGETEAARGWVEATRAAIAPATPAEGEKKNNNIGLQNMLTDLAKSSVFQPMEALVDARIAVSEGRLADAAAALDGKQFRSAVVTDELYAAYAAAASSAEGEVPALPELGEKMERKAPKLAQLADSLLMRPESERKLIDYKKSRPNILGALIGGAATMGIGLLGGIPRTSGFEETENEDGSIKVEYTGNTTSGAVVQEMTLLRAAEIAQAAGKSHFHISGRKDFQRYLTMTQYGVEQSRTLTGYKTDMTIRLLDSPEDQPHAIDAVEIIDALGPIYYGD
ncbi:hypothetical protein K3152_11735 [Qipengyuania sp. 1NDH17]|uniref:Tetratricopeptide repeat protein n=1 Tax=Qipengyuania polymorpha TaxID=2867234 RepID=A0ABS7J4D0_9SPHN|nr:hypothetical protein [Qipengyuania polymorpha]MBX7458919.1 hypothetical protein [Qipengyuania polymorpha]